MEGSPEATELPASRPSGRLSRPAIHRRNAALWARAAQGLGRFDAALRARVILALLGLTAVVLARAAGRTEIAAPLATAAGLVTAATSVAMLAGLVHFHRFLPRELGLRRLGVASFVTLLVSCAVAVVPWVADLHLRSLGRAPVWMAGVPGAVASAAEHVGLMMCAMLVAASVRRAGAVIAAEATLRHAVATERLLALATSAVAAAHVAHRQGWTRREDVAAAVAIVVAAIALTAVARLLGLIRHFESEVHEAVETGAADRTSEWETIARI